MSNNNYSPINKNTLDFSSKLRNARISCGYTQEQVAELINCAPRYLASLESGNNKGSISVIINLCNLYNLNPNILFEDFLTTTSNYTSSEICGYNNLNDEHKQIIINSISFLSKLEKS